MLKTLPLPMRNNKMKQNKNNSKMNTVKSQSILTRKTLLNGCAASSSSLNSNLKLQALDSLKITKKKEPTDSEKESPALHMPDLKCKVYKKPLLKKLQSLLKALELTMLSFKILLTTASPMNMSSMSTGLKI